MVSHTFNVILLDFNLIYSTGCILYVILLDFNLIYSTGCILYTGVYIERKTTYHPLVHHFLQGGFPLHFNDFTYALVYYFYNLPHQTLTG